jgi:Mrp family chromosome partitioning ATPase
MNLYFLPAGTLIGNQAELLSSPVFEKLVRQAEEYFDWVIIDSPPVLAFADARILSEVTGGTILVVSSARTPVPLVKDSIQTLGPDRICGVVMNRVRDLKINTYFKDYYEQVEK